MSPQQSIAHYRLLAKIGSGGMGEVWRATDTKLGRDVAVKVLPAALAQDPASMARFRREAQVLASLNHQNIAAIYGLEDSTATAALVMELVAGAPLSAKIQPRGMPVDQVLRLAIQIAAGLEAAHKTGVVHRDLKPSNVMVTPEGGVKLLDFGLAKFLEKEIDPADETETIASITQTDKGYIIGTAAYMSPEQAEGRPADARSDIFSFGIVLFEMLTGRRPFGGESKMSTLAAILREEPKRPGELTATPLPREVERIILRCLRKDPERRFQASADLRLALEDAAEDLAREPLPETSPRQITAGSRWRWAGAAIAILAVAASAVWMLRPHQQSLVAPHQITFEAGIAQEPALSPDGKLLAYVSDRAGEGQTDIWLKQVAGGDPVRLTSNPGPKNFPQFSADGTKILYLGSGDLFEVPTLGGSPRRVLAQVGPSFAISSRGEIVSYWPSTADAPASIKILPAVGGAPETWHPECRTVALPAWSPDGDRLAFLGDCSGKNQVYKVNVFVAPRRGGTVQPIGTWENRILGVRLAWFSERRGRDAVVLPQRTGDSINLFRIGLDGSRAPVTLGAGSEKMPSVSRSGDLAFSRSEDSPAVWSLPLEDLLQKPVREAAPAQGYVVSRDCARLIFGRMLGPIRGELVARDRASGAESVLAVHELLSEGAGSLWPQISPEGSQIVYRAYADTFGTYAVSTDGGAPRLWIPLSKLGLATDWSADGKTIIGECTPRTEGICAADPASGETRVLLKDAKGGLLLYPSFSWDGKWITFMLRRAGKTVICATPVGSGDTPRPEADWVRISPENDQATRPRFSPDGAGIFYALVRKTTMEIVRQKLDPASKRPMGEPAKIASAPFSGPGQFIIGVTRDRLFFNTDEIRSNIWMTRLE
jgi:serine/threonine protein kinase